MELVIRLGERIRFLRKDKNMSQERLGELAGLHTNYIGSIERGEKNVTIESLVKVTRGLDITLDELFRYVEPKENRDELHAIIDLLFNRPEEDRKLALKLLEDVFHWEKEKYKL